MKRTANYKNTYTYRKPDIFAYTLARLAAWPIAHFVFHRHVLRNELRGKKGGFVIIANHQSALDFVNLIGLCRRRLIFVISRSFYSTLPLKKIFDRKGVLPKQQFQTELKDIKQMKAIVAAGAPLVLYPAGMMCEDGASTPIPKGTYSLLRLLDVDVYMARTAGTYHVMPKWSKRLHPGKTTMDIYRLFTREELHSLTAEEIRQRAEAALSFDAYTEQESLRIPYRGGDNVEGLEYVVYQCPICRKKHTIRAFKNTLRCEACGFTASADRFSFLHSTPDGPRYVSQWSRDILQFLADTISEQETFSLPCTVYTLNTAQHRFEEAGTGIAEITEQEISLKGQINGMDFAIRQSVAAFPILPFSPGRFFEIQYGQDIYRCYPQDGKYVMEFINTLKIRHSNAQKRICRQKERDDK